MNTGIKAIDRDGATPETWTRAGRGLGRATGIVLIALAFSVGAAQARGPIPQDLQPVVKAAYDKFKDDQSGKNADYIPELARCPRSCSVS